MTEAEENREQAIGYLFGELTDAERDAVEDRLFADDELSLFLSAVEKDLVDDYARGEMDAALRQRFERNYLKTASRREKIRLAGVLQSEVFAEKLSAPEIAPAAAEEPKLSFWSALADFFRAPNLALAGGLAVILLFLLAGGWMLLRRPPNAPEIVRDDNANRLIPVPTVTPENKPSNENASNENSNTDNSNAAPTTETNVNQAPAIENKLPENKAPEKRPTPAPQPTQKPEKTPPTQPRTVFATLFPLNLRSGDELPTLLVRKYTESVRLRVVHDNLETFARFRVEIRNQNGDVLLTREMPFNRKNPSRPIDLNIRAATLDPGAYELVLNGIREDGSAQKIKSYQFSIRKK